jgi:bifunctional DNA-binding transcriptional regulator/antitoxin component of YhaV-PrlF toxin-antitoxin module
MCHHIQREEIAVLTQLQANSQITLPEVLVEKLGFSVGDEFDISEREGTICLTPLTGAIHHSWPKEFIDLLGSVDDDTFVAPDDVPLSDIEPF